jgi:hypothetical protein
VRGVDEAGVEEGDVGADGGVGNHLAELPLRNAHAPCQRQVERVHLAAGVRLCRRGEVKRRALV